MAMIKERQRDKCGSVNKKGKNNHNLGSSTVVSQHNHTLKNNSFKNDTPVKDQRFAANNSPSSVTCSFMNSETFAMEMCPVENFMLDTAPLSSCQSRKNEDIMNSDPVFPPDPCDAMMSMGSTESLVDGGVRPMNSNVINKQPSTMDAQYMQQQSQVFVFSTAMANKSAENVKNGKFSSIIEYHCAQPDTKKYLMRNPLKINQFNRQNQAIWMNNVPMKNKSSCAMGNTRLSAKGNFRNNPMMSADMMNQSCGGPPPPLQPTGMNMPPRIPMWNQQGNMNPNPMMPNSVLPPPLANFNEDQFPLSPQTPLTGVQIPDENLTPVQRQRRVEKLAHLRKIRQELMPDNQPPPSQMSMNPELPPSSHNPPISIDDISSVLAADSNNGNSAPLGDPNEVSLSKTTNSGPGAPPMTPSDWQNMPSFFDDRGKRMPDVNNMNRCGPRSQGPPPPYHQTARSASVPIAVPSPNPNSPGNATSNLSLPSPRTCSGLNSPASKPGPGPSPTTNQMNTSIESPGQSHGRGVNISNPGTPVSTGIHLSPNSKQKDSKMCGGPLSSEFSPAASGQQSPDGIYSRSLQSLARQQQQKQQPPMPHTQSMPPANSHCKEPPLMPVPSPQHIQYLSSFEGQELTIQKQPNTSIKDTSPSISQSGLDSMIPVSSDGSCSKVTVSAPNTPLTPSSMADLSSKYPGTPGDFSALSPSADPKTQLRGINSNQLKNDLRFPCSSPQLPDQQRFPPTNTNFMPQGNKNFMDDSSPEKASCGMGPEGKDVSSCAGGNFPRGMMPNNVPIDPTAAPKPSFDPISSLAQMSQQLTNNVPNSMCPTGPEGGPGGSMSGGNMLGQYPPMMGQMNQQMPNNMPGPMCPNGPDGGPNGPKPGNMPGQFTPMMGGNPPRMMRPPGPMPGAYNNANVQVKPNAPNTIQYLPNRPQSGPGVNARGPPSLEFLRYQNPNAMPPNMEKMHPHPNMNYFQGNYPGGPPPGPNMNEMMGNINCNMPPGNPMIRPGIRGPNPPPNMMRMGGGNMGMPSYNDQMYPPGGPNMPNNNCHMFMPNAGGPGPKMAPMGMGGNVAPDATQPLPPSMGQANNFKNQSFMGQLTPEMNDPQYRQQFHNFQQQLYATNTRSQMNNQPMAGSNQQYFVPK